MERLTTDGYVLTATLGSVSEEVVLTDVDEESATFEAINLIMDKAYADKQGPWAKGAITLVDPAGNVLQSMDAK